jgi:hypothetical protein
MRPERCRLSNQQYSELIVAASPGDIGFVEGRGLVGTVNKWYQRRMRRVAPVEGFLPTHVFIVGHHGRIYESLVWGGPVIRAAGIDNYVAGNRHRLVIGRLDYDYSVYDVNRACMKIEDYIHTKDPYYDFVSLSTFGAIQSNHAAICSELLLMFSNMLLRFTESWKMVSHDQLSLPVDWLKHVKVVWRE